MKYAIIFVIMNNLVLLDLEKLLIVRTVQGVPV